MGSQLGQLCRFSRVPRVRKEPSPKPGGSGRSLPRHCTSLQTSPGDISSNPGKTWNHEWVSFCSAFSPTGAHYSTCRLGLSIRGFLKAGLAGEDVPRVVFPCMLSRTGPGEPVLCGTEATGLVCLKIGDPPNQWFAFGFSSEATQARVPSKKRNTHSVCICWILEVYPLLGLL